MLYSCFAIKKWVAKASHSRKINYENLLIVSYFLEKMSIVFNICSLLIINMYYILLQSLDPGRIRLQFQAPDGYIYALDLHAGHGLHPGFDFLLEQT